jgi:ankyrin repeat protein
LTFDNFIRAINSNDIRSVKTFLSNKDFNPAKENNLAFIYACFKKHTYIFKLLLNDNRINPTDRNNIAFIHACYYNKNNLVNIFIKNNIYSFDFDFENKEEFYFLKKIYPTLNKDVNKFLNSMNKEHIIIELQKDLISDKISTF